MKTRAIVSELKYNVSSTRAMVSDLNRTGVSNTQTVYTTEYIFTTAQNQVRLAKLTANGSSVLNFHLVCLVNRLHQRREPALDVTS